MACALAVVGLASGADAAHAVVHGMGAKPPTENVPLRATSARSAPLTLPASVDLRAWSVPIGDQGQVGSCTAWTLAHSLAGWYARRAGLPRTAFSPMYLYSQINHGTDAGAYLEDGLRYGRSAGNVPESDYPQGNYDWWSKPTSSQFAIGAHYRFSHPQTLMAKLGGHLGAAFSTALKTALASEQPVTLSLPVRAGFDALSPTNTLDTDTTSSIRGNHMILAVGYDASGVLIQNQWGTGWGTNGYGRLAWNVIENDVYEAGVIAGLDRSNVVFSDATAGNTLTSLNDNSTTGWEDEPIGSNAVAAGSSPTAVQVNEQGYVFYADATRGNAISYANNTPALSIDWFNFPISASNPVMTGSSPAAVNVDGEAQVFYADASTNNRISMVSRPSKGWWSQMPFYGNEVAAGTSPTAVTQDGLAHVFYVDATNGNTITYWRWFPTYGWKQTFFYGDRVAAGTSPSAAVVAGKIHVFFVDADKGNTITDWTWNSATGWKQTFFGGHAAAAGTSPSAMDENTGTPRVSFVDATNGNTVSSWSWHPDTAWLFIPFYGHRVATGSSPTSDFYDDSAHVFSTDVTSAVPITDWQWKPTVGWLQHPVDDHAVAAGSSPAALH